MTELGVIDDNDYAVRKLQKIVDDKKVSIRFAKQLLISEGVDSDIADFAAEQIEYNPQNTLLMLIEKKYKNQKYLCFLPIRKECLILYWKQWHLEFQAFPQIVPVAVPEC